MLSLSFPGAEGEALLHRMDLMGIAISTGSACDRQSTQISHVLQAIGLREDLARGTVRISLSRENTEEEVKRIAECLGNVLGAHPEEHRSENAEQLAAAFEALREAQSEK